MATSTISRDGYSQPLIRLDNYGGRTALYVLGMEMSRGCTCVRLEKEKDGGPEFSFNVCLDILESSIRKMTEAQVSEICNNFKTFWREANTRNEDLSLKDKE